LLSARRVIEVSQNPPARLQESHKEPECPSELMKAQLSEAKAVVDLMAEFVLLTFFVITNNV